VSPTPRPPRQTTQPYWQPGAPTPGRPRTRPALRALLADDVTFRGPLGSADDADSCITGLQHMAQVLDHLEVHARAGRGSDVLTWFDLHSTVAPPAPTANWTRVENGRITQIRVAFDPRALLAGLEASRDASAPATGGTDDGQ